VRDLPKPVVARVEGPATAAGCHLVAACDLAVASAAATFAVPGPVTGLVGTTAMVEVGRLIGRRRAMQMVLTGAPISAATALEWGLVNAVVPARDLAAAALALARSASAGAPLATALAKRGLHEALDRPVEQAYADAVDLTVRTVPGAEAQEGIAAFLEKRRAAWPSREGTGSPSRRRCSSRISGPGEVPAAERETAGDDAPLRAFPETLDLAPALIHPRVVVTHQEAALGDHRRDARRSPRLTPVLRGDGALRPVQRLLGGLDVDPDVPVEPEPDPVPSDERIRTQGGPQLREQRAERHVRGGRPAAGPEHLHQRVTLERAPPAGQEERQQQRPLPAGQPGLAPLAIDDDAHRTAEMDPRAHPDRH
jgi:hypothetical protein